MEKIKRENIFPKERSHKMKVRVKLNLRKDLSILNAHDMVT
jgi:hypothetical protein